MQTISSVGISGGHLRLLTTVVGGSALFVLAAGVSTLHGDSLFIALGIVVVLLAALAVFRMARVEIAADPREVVLRLKPFYSTSIRREDILCVQPSPETSVPEGFGYRILGSRRRGLLAGGPAVEIATASRTWVVSCPAAHRVAPHIAPRPAHN